MARGDPVRARVAVHDRGAHVGYLTTVGYPDRDISAFQGGLPYFEFVISDTHEKHVALLQRFRQHWLIHCGHQYDTTDIGGELTIGDMLTLAVFALRHRAEPEPARVGLLKSHVEEILAKDRS